MYKSRHGHSRVSAHEHGSGLVCGHGRGDSVDISAVPSTPIIPTHSIPNPSISIPPPPSAPPALSVPPVSSTTSLSLHSSTASHLQRKNVREGTIGTGIAAMVATMGSSVIAFSFKSDWDDKPFTNEDLQTIEAALQSTFKRPLPSSSHNHDDDNDDNSGSPDPPTGGGGGGSRRKLPSSILASQDPNPFSLSPCRAANLRMRYLVMKFAGQITYSRTVVEVEAAAMELLKTVEAKNREVGEWRPTFKKG
ncbi:hypothetical protein FEM48_Zijuj10G0084300 [Ziziphus jujuba var. spinosa]|uniref:Uncharacterized protein n=1 Tax=Ziziphus jujuba var. spinosa TaxID=714518 RepID=A0A978UMB4_ZIZJJ|nr:hypothetical protein FEM48_Zijuj10G0084300 [Ziziphus jujuba var. spinosa]